MMIRRVLTLAIGMGLSSLSLAAPIAPGAAVAVPPEQFRIMTEQEIAEHKAKMASLAGTAREEYRNAQYEMLKKRALAQGYQLPDVPPWGRTEVLPAAMPDAEPLATTPPAVEPPKPADLPKLIEQQRKVVEAAIAAAGDAADAAPPAPAPAEPPKPAAPVPPATPDTVAAPPGPAATPAPAMADDFQRRMRERFERFRAERAAREAQLAEERLRRQQQMQRRRQAFQQRMPRVPMAPPGYGQAPAYGYPPMPMQRPPMPRQMPYPQPYYPGYPQGYPAR